MYRCEVCDVILQERYKTKHNQSKKHKYYSNLILNRYVIKDVEVAKFKDVFDPYFTHHSRKFNFFTVCIIIRYHSDLFEFYDSEHPPYHKISIPNNVIYNIQSEHYSTYTREAASDFLHKVISIYFSHRCSPKIICEIEIVFISDPKDVTRQHYLEQPKSMLCRKLIRKIHELTTQDFEYNWLPDSFKNL